MAEQPRGSTGCLVMIISALVTIILITVIKRALM